MAFGDVTVVAVLRFSVDVVPDEVVEVFEKEKHSGAAKNRDSNMYQSLLIGQLLSSVRVFLTFFVRSLVIRRFKFPALQGT